MYVFVVLLCTCSTLLTSMSSQVYQSLANLIQWADHRMLDRSQMDHKCIHEYIDPLEKGIKVSISLLRFYHITMDLVHIMV